MGILKAPRIRNPEKGVEIVQELRQELTISELNPEKGVEIAAARAQSGIE